MAKKKEIWTPVRQVATFAGSAAVSMIFASLFLPNPIMVWLIGGSCLLLFSIMNNGLSFFVDNFKQYLIQSTYCFMGLLIGMGLLATLLSGVSIFDAESYRPIFIIILIANFIFMAMIITVKGLLALMEEKDKRL